MKNFSFRILLSIMVCSIVTTTLLCSTSIYRSSSIILKETEKALILSSEKYAKKFELTFRNTESMVDAVAANVSATFNLTEHDNNPNYFSEYRSSLDTLVHEIIKDNQNIHGLYFTFSPYLTEIPQEVWYAYGNNNIPEKISIDLISSLRDFTLPAKPEMEYFFKPVQSGSGAWTGPYLDADLSINMVSYSKAVFAGDVIVGVAGADILLTDTLDLVETMKIYDDSSAFLLDEDLNLVSMPRNYADSAFWTNREDFTISSAITSKSSGLIKTYKLDSAFILSHSRLANGWILIIEQPAASAYTSMNGLAMILVWVAIAVMFLFFIFAVVLSKKLSKSISNSTKSLNLLSSGDYLHQSPEDLNSPENYFGEFSQGVFSVQETFLLKVNQNKEKDLLLTKYANVSNLVDRVSLHWKEPFSSINLSLLNLYDSYLCGDMTDEIFKSSIDKIQVLVYDILNSIDASPQFLDPVKDGSTFEHSN